MTLVFVLQVWKMNTTIARYWWKYCCRSGCVHLLCGFLIGAFLSSLVGNTDKTESVQEFEESSIDKNVKKKVFLCVAIISAPSYYKERNLIRRTWTSLIPVNVSINFFIGTLNLPMQDRLSLLRENHINQDMVLLNDVEDAYDNLTEKMAEIFKWIIQNVQSDFILKVDTDTYVNLKGVVDSLKTKPKEHLYLGYISLYAPVLREGKWADPDFSMCETYLPFAVGGGYVLSYDLVQYIVNNLNILRKYINEDVTVGTWLAPLKIDMRDDPGFNMGGLELSGCSDNHIVVHPVSYVEMKFLHRNLKSEGTICGKNFTMDRITTGTDVG